MVSDVVPVAVPVCDEQMATPLIGVVIPFVVQLDDQSMLRWSVPLPLFQVQRVSSKLGVNATHLETAIAGDVIVVYADTNTDNINIRFIILFPLCLVGKTFEHIFSKV